MCTKRLSGNKKDSTLQMTKHDLYLADEASSPVDDVHIIPMNAKVFFFVIFFLHFFKNLFN